MNHASTSIRWGILGTARIATKIARAIAIAPNAELTAIASRNLATAQEWANKHGIDNVYENYSALLDDNSIDAVYIPLPPSMHAEWTIAAAQYGKHVLCEKPIALSTTEVEAMSSACQLAGVQLMDGVMWVHHKRTTLMKRHIKTSLGQLRRVTAAFSFNWPELPSDNIRVKKDLGGGSLGDLGYYCVRAILWAFNALPVRVQATARYRNNIDYSLQAILCFDGERAASFDCGFDTATRKWFEVAGTHGSLVCDDFVVPESEDQAGYWLHGSGNQDGKYTSDGCVQEACMIETFCRQIAEGHLELGWVADAAATVHVCEALATAARTGQSVDI